MILNIKNIFFICLVFIGYYFFYIEYDSLNNTEYSFKKVEVAESEVDINEVNSINETLQIEELKEKIIDEEKINKTKLKKIEITISEGDTFLSILNRFNFPESIIFQIINKIENFYDLRKLKIDNKINFYEDLKKNIKKIEITIDIDSVLIVNIEDSIKIEKKKLEKSSFEVSYEY